MFIYSIKGQNLKLVFSLLASAMAIILVVALFPTEKTTPLEENAISAGVEIKDADYKNIKENEDRVAFLKKLGWEVESEPREIKEVQIPEEFDSVFSQYNKIQLSSGLNLEKYKGKSVKKYTYLVSNYDYDGSVYANLLVYKDRVIGGDISSARSDGFVHSLLGADNLET